MVLMTTTNAHAQTKQKLNIEQATVFLSGAELTSTATVSLSKGENEVIFSNVAGNVNSQSLNLGATNGVVVESATFQNNYLATEVFSPRAKELKDSIDVVGDHIEEVSNKIAVITEEMAILKENRKVSGNANGLSVAELTKMLDLINAKMEGYLNQKDKLDKQLAKADDYLAKLNSQLNEEKKKDYQPGGQLLVKFYTKEATTATVSVDYVVPGAGWSPTYDIVADDAHSPIKLFYKANIHQSCGVSWNNVRLSLSTGNPNEGAQAPAMNPWYLAFYTPPVTANTYKKALIQGDIATMPTTQTDDLTASAPGMYQQGRGANVNIGGARSEGTLYIIDGVQVQNTSVNNYVSVDNAGINASFDIDLPYTIPTDGQQHLVAIKKYELPASYRYYVVPKLDKDAFLQAQVTNWEDLNLLPGQSNIFYEGTYVGQGYIDVRNIKDTMTLSLGRDKKIVVKRDQDTKLRSTKTIGTNVREAFAYTISVRNTRKENITLVVQDQQPVSTNTDIAIEERETAGAEFDEKTGIMNWTIGVAPNETKKISFGYTVKYPKGKIVAGLK
jgi:uncharacterized protein (TIGR02231 family)